MNKERLKDFGISKYEYAEKGNMQQVECGQYYDTLDKFCSVIVKMNRFAADGATLKQLQINFQKLAPDFLTLCGEEKAAPAKKKGRPKKNTLPVRDEWGLCPVCGQKNIKIRPQTVLIDYPMYCKRCKCDHVVSWSAV